MARLITREIGKPYDEALGEAQEVIATCDFFLGEGRHSYGHTVPSEMPDKKLFTYRVPVGVSTIITAGNFPASVPSWYLVPALLCGNTVVWKPAEYAATTARALAELAGVPRGALHLVYADGESTFRGVGTRADRWPGRQGRVHRLHRGGQSGGRIVRALPPVTLPGTGREEPDGGRGGR